VEIARHAREIEAVRRRQRQHDGVFGGCRLQLEVELEAKALAKRQSPRAVDAAAERRMDDELHAAALVEESLENDGGLRGQRTERGLRARQVIVQLRYGRRPD